MIIALEAERAVESRDFADHLVEGLRWDGIEYNVIYDNSISQLRNERTVKRRLEIGGTGDYGLGDWYAVCGTVRLLVDRR